MRRMLILAYAIAMTAESGPVRVNPDGVNVNSQGPTTVFLTFGGLVNQVAAEAFWCGELISAAPDIGSKCRPDTIFGSLPLRFNQSTPSGSSGFTDIMSIPASVARRAYQAAADGQTSSFFYVRRFVSTAGAPDEYVTVTCRLSGGGARVPLSLLDVQMRFTPNVPVLFVKPGEKPSGLTVAITYSGTGRLKGRWEIVQPGEELPTPDDLLTEATLPIERRALQRRYTTLDRFNTLLTPTGRITLPGPRPDRLPVAVEGTYFVLFRVEASDDKEADSNLATAGAGTGIVHSGAVAGFPMPALRYIVSGAAPSTMGAAGLTLLQPSDSAAVPANATIDLVWTEVPSAALYRVEVQTTSGELAIGALVPPGLGLYRLPPWIKDKSSDGRFRWRVSALGADGKPSTTSDWRQLLIGQK